MRHETKINLLERKSRENVIVNLKNPKNNSVKLSKIIQWNVELCHIITFFFNIKESFFYQLKIFSSVKR